MLLSLIKGLTKAEKRNFKLYVNRLGTSASNAKFVALYDAIESTEDYDETRILSRCPTITKTQLPNLKAHLYKQLLISLSNLYSAHDRSGEIRRMIEFASILLDKSLVVQTIKMLEKAKEMALYSQFYTLALEVLEFEKRLELMHLGHSTPARVSSLSRQATQLSAKISNINALSNLTIQLCNLNLKLGYMRSEKDKNLITTYFKRKLVAYDSRQMDFHELLYLYQSKMWYSYIQYDFVHCYRWAKQWYGLFDNHDHFKILYFDHYIRSVSRLLDVMFMTRQLSPMENLIEKLEAEATDFLPNTNKAAITVEITLLFAKINSHFLRGNFTEGLYLAKRVNLFIDKWGNTLDEHYRMMLYYKVACLYFGSEDYKQCIRYLQKIISVRNPSFRRDLQVFARILNLIASYEIADDATIEYQIRSVYTFVVKINDMHAVQHAIISFLRRLPKTYAGDFKTELQKLYDELKPLESHPYQRRPFFYLDIISWLESKLQGVPISQIRKNKITPSR